MRRHADGEKGMALLQPPGRAAQTRLGAAAQGAVLAQEGERLQHRPVPVAHLLGHRLQILQSAMATSILEQTVYIQDQSFTQDQAMCPSSAGRPTFLVTACAVLRAITNSSGKD